MPRRPPPIPYPPGTLFTLPLDRGGFGVCLVARWTANRRLGQRAVTLYGFDRVFAEPPSFEQAATLGIFDTACIMVHMDEELHAGRWKVLGTHPEFSWRRWPDPPCMVDERCDPPNLAELYRQEGKPPPPRPSGDERLCATARENVWGGKNVQAAPYITPEEFHLLPPRGGLGLFRGMEGFLRMAVCDRNPRYHIAVTPRSLEVWERIRLALVRDGVIEDRDAPASAPAANAATGPERVSKPQAKRAKPRAGATKTVTDKKQKPGRTGTPVAANDKGRSRPGSTRRGKD